jgi:hypothetical protein
LPELERELRALAGFVDLPGERELVPAVLARLAQRRSPGRWRRIAGVAALVLVVGLAATMAVPDARTAVLRFLGLKGVTVIRVDELPPASTTPHVFGESVSLAGARRIVGFRPLLPEDLGAPDDVRINRFSPYFIVLLYGRPNVRLRLTETSGGVIQKYAQFAQRVERVEVDGQPGIWVEGEHVVAEPFGMPRLSGNVLLWEQGDLTLRLEGRLDKEQALDIARSVP